MTYCVSGGALNSTHSLKQITAAATSSSAESAISAIFNCCPEMLSCVTRMLTNKCWPTFVGGVSVAGDRCKW